MRRGQFVAAVLAMTLAFGLPRSGVALAAQAPPCGPSATQFDVAGSLTPGTPLPILSNPASPLQVALVGIAGTFQGHIVFTPLSAPPPAISDGCQENSRFTVEGFIGSVVVTGPLAGALFGADPHFLLSTTQPTNASLQVHFGPQPSKPVLTFHSDPPVLFFPQAGQPGVPVRFLQIVGLEVTASN